MARSIKRQKNNSKVNLRKNSKTYTPKKSRKGMNSRKKNKLIVRQHGAGDNDNIDPLHVHESGEERRSLRDSDVSPMESASDSETGENVVTEQPVKIGSPRESASDSETSENGPEATVVTAESAHSESGSDNKMGDDKQTVPDALTNANEARRAEESKAAALQQAHARGQAARDQAKMMRTKAEEEQEAALDVAAAKLQAQLRGKAARNQAEKMRNEAAAAVDDRVNESEESLLAEEDATKLQAQLRGKADRSKVERVKLELAEARARQELDQERARLKLAEAEESKAAALLQAHARGKATRNQVEQARQEQAEEQARQSKAAALLQAHARGKATRNQVERVRQAQELAEQQEKKRQELAEQEARQENYILLKLVEDARDLNSTPIGKSLNISPYKNKYSLVSEREGDRLRAKALQAQMNIYKESSDLNELFQNREITRDDIDGDKLLKQVKDLKEEKIHHDMNMQASLRKLLHSSLKPKKGGRKKHPLKKSKKNLQKKSKKRNLAYQKRSLKKL